MLGLLLMSFTANAQTKWLISETSSLSVNGSTNINKFSCDIPNCDLDTLTVWKSDKGIKLSGSINPTVLSFDCHKAMMTHDLRKTLKAKKYPKLHIRFISLSQLPELSGKPISINGQVEIEIAGIKKIYEIDYSISVDNDKMIHLLGSRDLNFSDFELTPPRKLGGMIKAKDQLIVAFNLNMKTI
ncbi:MAG: hypothetical protein JWQ66_3629 [Mucilaginibacter sp.]|nr:hypothetical protein [Mucilaginibacter sp.]